MTNEDYPLLLGVNIDHVATLRQARLSSYPSVYQAAFDALEAGADYITIHLREDRRHIQDSDLKELIRNKVKINLEICPSDEMIAIALENRPDFCCLVPEKRQELTTEGGLDLINNFDQIQSAVASLQQENISVSLFIEPVKKFIEAAKKLNAPIVELHTGNYANKSGEAQYDELMKIKDAAEFAKAKHLTVNAGHGLDYSNVAPVANIPDLSELNIGHSIISRSISVGLKKAVAEMKILMQR